jgi:hypothetical protein
MIGKIQTLTCTLSEETLPWIRLRLGTFPFKFTCHHWMSSFDITCKMLLHSLSGNRILRLTNILVTKPHNSTPTILNWHAHICFLCHSLSRTFFIIKSVSTLSSHVLWNIYFAYFHSQLRYGIILWGRGLKKA